MHLADALPTTASSDSNIVLDDALSRDLVVVARLLAPPADLRGESFCEIVALMVAVINDPSNVFGLLSGRRYDPSRYCLGSINTE